MTTLSGLIMENSVDWGAGFLFIFYFYKYFSSLLKEMEAAAGFVSFYICYLLLISCMWDFPGLCYSYETDSTIVFPLVTQLTA